MGMASSTIVSSPTLSNIATEAWNFASCAGRDREHATKSSGIKGPSTLECQYLSQPSNVETEVTPELRHIELQRRME